MIECEIEPSTGGFSVVTVIPEGREREDSVIVRSVNSVIADFGRVTQKFAGVFGIERRW